MRQVTAQKVPKGQSTAQVFHVLPPTGGLNTRDPPAMVPITEATAMTNYFPTTTGCTKRLGYTNHVTGITNAEYFQSMMVYAPKNASDQLFGAKRVSSSGDYEFFDLTTAGVLGAPVVTGLTTAIWQSINFTNSAGTIYLCCFSGIDAPQYWDGATWTAITAISTPSITGLTTTDIIAAAVHQRRIWMVQINSLKLWYLTPDSVGGLAKSLDLGGIASLGGYVMCVAVWTVDSGVGPDDVLVCITSKGQVIAYKGTDPTSASTWELVGVWNVAEPLGRRSMYEYKGDVLILTKAGIYSVARIFSGDTSNSGLLTDKISTTYLARVAGGSNFDTWQLLYYQKANMLIWFGSVGTFTDNFYVMNTVTGAWSGSFGTNGGPALVLFRGDPYYSGLNSPFQVRKFWSSATDNGTSIAGSIYHGYSEFEQPGIIKQALQSRIVISCASAMTVDISLQYDYSTGVTAGSTSIAALTGITQWMPAQGRGVSFSPVYTASSAGTDTYNGCYILYQSGGMVGASQQL